MGDDKTWLLTVGNIPLDKNNLNVQQFNGFVLAKKYTPVEVDFSNKSWLGVVEDIQGLAAPEAWGAWSVGNEISIKLTDPLPSKFRLIVEGRAYGPNIGTPSIIQIGEINYPVIFQSEMQTISIDVANADNARVLTIRIPKPTSPKDLGLSVDERKLGIGLKSLKIIKL
jgi:phosphoglycerol transferase